MLINLPANFIFPDNFYVACSGGVDSMALLSFALRGKKNFKVAHFNHGTPSADLYENFVKDFCQQNNLELMIGRCSAQMDSQQTPELYWATERHKFFSSLDAPVFLAHHLNDVAETWLMSCLNGKPHLMAWETRNCIRPFLMVPKQNLVIWCTQFNIPWVEDLTNFENGCRRNLVRSNLLPGALEINPGLFTVLKKMLINRGDNGKR